MGHLGGRKLGSLRWLALLSVAVVVTAPSSCVNAIVDNYPADGYLHSGYFWPKTIYWHGIRHPPGIYWFVYFFFSQAALYSMITSLVSNCIVGELRDALDSVISFDFITEYLFVTVSSGLGVGLLFITVAATNLSDVVQAYLIGMCVIQVLVDTLRSTIRSKPEKAYAVSVTVTGFQVSAAFGIALLDSYRPLNQLNAAYSAIGVIISLLITSASANENKIRGFIAGLLQMVFCVAAFFIANQVADVNKTQTMTFLLTAVANFLLISFVELMTSCST